jgi:hypothetical protein
MFRRLLDNNHIEVRLARNTKPLIEDDTTPAVDSEEMTCEVHCGCWRCRHDRWCCSAYAERDRCYRC